MLAVVLFFLSTAPVFRNFVELVHSIGHPTHRVQEDTLAWMFVIGQFLSLAIALPTLLLLLYTLFNHKTTHETTTDPDELGSDAPDQQAQTAAPDEQSFYVTPADKGRKPLLNGSVTNALAWLIQNPAAVLSVLVLIIGLNSILMNSIILLGERDFVLSDDAMISMRYARNLADGHGLVWNVGERVEGYSNFLWVIIMAAVHVVGVPENQTAVYIMLLNWSMVIGMLWLLQSTLRKLNVSGLWLYAGLLVFVTDRNILYWSHSGLETIITTFMVVLCLWAIFHEHDLWFGMSLALIPLTRSDAALLAVLLGLMFIGHNWQTRRVRAIAIVALATIPSIAHMLFRIGFYGSTVPNTYYQKMSPQIDSLRALGFGYALRLVESHGVFLLLAGATLFIQGIDRRVRWLLIVVLAQVAYVIYAGGDAFRYVRFLTPILPALYIAAFVAADRLTRSLPRLSYQAFAVGLVLLVAPVTYDEARLFNMPQFSSERSWAVIGQILENNIPPETLTTVTGAGTTPYYAEEHRFLDALGLNDAHIAQVDPQEHHIWVGHNKYDYDYVYNERQPDVVIAKGDCTWTLDLLRRPVIERMQRAAAELTSPWAFYELYHPGFLRDYQQHPVNIFDPNGQVFDIGRCLFVRGNSDIPDVWTITGEPINQIRTTFDFPMIAGAGWGDVEMGADDLSLRPTNGNVATLRLPLATDLTLGNGYQITMRLATEPGVWQRMRVLVNGQLLDQLAGQAEGDINEAGMVLIQGPIPGAAVNTYPTEIAFLLPEGEEAVFDWLVIEPQS